MPSYSSPAQIKVGVIGYGGAFNMGQAHLNEMKLAGMTPVAVAEIDPKRLAQAPIDFPGIQTYRSHLEMLKKSDVNLITIITPHNTHAPLALDCLRAGKHVLAEKPFAITTAECDAMIREAKKRKLVLSTYHNRHWDGCILKALELIKKEKRIGEIIRIEARMGSRGKPNDWWRTSRTISGGILYDWGVHLLEYSLQLIDSKVVEVSGFAKEGYWANQTVWKKDTNEDEATLTARFANGKWLTLRMTQMDSNPKPGFLEITGTEGSYLVHWGEYEIIRKEGNVLTTETGKHPKNEGAKLYQNIADHMTKGTKLIITGEWARRPIEIIELGMKSAKQNKALKPKYG